ncbi:DinB family protein [Chitinophaga sp. 30R24]|uniref:DinB family protein n=1 Tax=Chitinophaga sp. 30R24 TaxID=3248838 RepID=UPI003B8F948F
MLTGILLNLYERDLSKLEEEIAAYGTNEGLWAKPQGINNSGGNLCLHLCGNLQYFVGAVLGNTGYVRQREREFSDSGLAKEELLVLISTTRRTVLSVIAGFSAEALEKTYPEVVFSSTMSTGYFLLRLLAHLNYHLGQINYHRRLTQS